MTVGVDAAILEVAVATTVAAGAASLAASAAATAAADKGASPMSLYVLLCGAASASQTAYSSPLTAASLSTAVAPSAAVSALVGGVSPRSAAAAYPAAIAAGPAAAAAWPAAVAAGGRDGAAAKERAVLSEAAHLPHACATGSSNGDSRSYRSHREGFNTEMSTGKKQEVLLLCCSSRTHARSRCN